MHQVEWARVIRAEVTWSRKGRPVVRVAVRDTPSVSRYRRDPHALRVKRKFAQRAHEFVDLVNDEVGRRQRWRAGEIRSGAEERDARSG